MSQLDTDGYRILNFRNFRIRIVYGYAKIFFDMDQELKNQYLLTSGVHQPVQPHTLYARLLVFDKTLAQPDFAVVICSDALMSVFTPMF